MTIIEVLGPDDWREFRGLRLRALADAPDSFGMTLAESRANGEEHWRHRLDGEDPIVAIRDAGDLVAMGAGWVPPNETDRMMVWGMWTAPEARGRGHALSLLTWLLEWAGQGDITTVELHVTEGNDGARRLYERAGFQGTGEWEPLREGSGLRIELMRRRSSSLTR